MLPVGTYRIAFRGVEESNIRGKPSWAKADIEVITVHDGGELVKPGAHATIIEPTSGDAASFGFDRLKRMFAAACGFEDEAEYDEYDPEGANLDACLGERNEFSENGNPCIGRFADVIVTRGNATPDGQDYYRNYEWYAVPEDDQVVKHQ